MCGGMGAGIGTWGPTPSARATIAAALASHLSGDLHEVNLSVGDPADRLSFVMYMWAFEGSSAPGGGTQVRRYLGKAAVERCKSSS